MSGFRRLAGPRVKPRRSRSGLAVLVAALMVLNVVGCFGFLSKAHLEHATIGEVAVNRSAAEIESRISVQQEIVTDYDAKIKQIDDAVARRDRARSDQRRYGARVRPA